MGRKRLAPEVLAARAVERERIGRALQAARATRGLTVPELAEQLGVSRAYMANIEAGRKPLTDALADAAASVLRVRKSRLLNPAEDVAA